jgi:polyferredoxin
MACIGCALCVDACNTVMNRFGLPPELITYDSISNQLARSRGKPTRLRMFRPRILAYIGILAVVVAVMAFSLTTRSRLEVNVLHDRSPLYVNLSDGDVRNGYTFKVLNMERAAKTYTLSTAGIDGATLSVIGYESDSVPVVELPVKPDDIGSFRVFVKAPRESLAGKSTDMSFILTDTKTGAVVEHSTPFFGPGD